MKAAKDEAPDEVLEPELVKMLRVRFNASGETMVVLSKILASEGILTMADFVVALQKFKFNPMRSKLKESSSVMFNALDFQTKMLLSAEFDKNATNDLIHSPMTWKENPLILPLEDGTVDPSAGDDVCGALALVPSTVPSTVSSTNADLCEEMGLSAKELEDL